MNTSIECIPCLVRQAAEAVEMCGTDTERSERLLRLLLREIVDADWSVKPVSMTQSLHRIIRAETGQSDPYRALKERMNRLALDLLPALSERARLHEDPREAAVRLAIAGNLLDSGSKTRIDPEEIGKHLDELWHTPLVGNVLDLFEAADSAGSILYLADNAGEIVFDRLLIEMLSPGKVTVSVRGVPIINDATMEDARAAGLCDMVKVVANGSDAPGTLLEECSPELLKAYDSADLIVAKGQGNYESLSDNTAKDIFFLLTVKCPVIAAATQAPLRSLVAKRGAFRP